MKIKLSAGDGQRYKVLSDAVAVDAANKPVSTVTILRTGNFWHPEYGDFAVTKELLESLVKNFNQNTYGQSVFLDRAHKPEDGAAAEITRLFIDGNKLRADVEWTQYGIELVNGRGYRYLSADYTENYLNTETKEMCGPLLHGAGLVTRPHIKRMERVDNINIKQFAESEGQQVSVTDTVIKLIEGELPMWKELIELLKAQLGKLELNESAASGLIKLAEASLTEKKDKDEAQAVIDQVLSTATLLKEQGAQSVNLSVTGVSLDDVKKLLQEQKEEEQRVLSEAKAAKDKNIKTLAERIDAAEGLADDDKTKLKKELGEIISGEMSESQIHRLADIQVASALQLIAAKRVESAGITDSCRVGTVRLSEELVGDANRLQQIQHDNLRLTRSFINGGIRRSEELHPFVKDVLLVFDAQNARAIHTEGRILADAGSTSVSDTALPMGFQREVIREALSDLNILQLIATYTDPSAQATTQIPYEVRKVGHIKNGGVTFERQPIQRAGVTQKMDLAYINARKLAIDVSNEVMHFTRASGINWDAWGRSLETASRILREMLCMSIANELQRASDAYASVAVANESIAAALDGSTAQIKTQHFPIVRPHQVFDLQGNTVGDAENPITIVIDGDTILPYDGSGEQPAGVYYEITNYNLGYVAFVDEIGDLVMPNATAASISYSRATNLLKVDSDIPNGVTPEVHLNKLLQAIGSQKAVMQGDRFVTPDYMLMSPILNDQASNAETFRADAKRAGTDTNAMGDLETIKRIPSFGTNAPGIDLGDERIIMGQRNTLSYTVAKPWAMSEVQEARDTNGQLIGSKECYGEEYGSIHVPKPIRNRVTSVLYYSFSNR